MNVGDMVHLTELALPQGVALVAFSPVVIRPEHDTFGRGFDPYATWRFAGDGAEGEEEGSTGMMILSDR